MRLNLFEKEMILDIGTKPASHRKSINNFNMEYGKHLEFVPDKMAINHITFVAVFPRVQVFVIISPYPAHPAGTTILINHTTLGHFHLLKGASKLNISRKRNWSGRGGASASIYYISLFAENYAIRPVCTSLFIARHLLLGKMPAEDWWLSNSTWKIIAPWKTWLHLVNFVSFFQIFQVDVAAQRGNERL